MEQEAREALAKHLENLAKEIREGTVEVTNMTQEYPITRYWANGNWEFFRLDDLTMVISYYDKEKRASERKKLNEYLAANPRAELHG